ncbi:MAG: glycosyltransferase [Bdellovibrionia bacterium]
MKFSVIVPAHNEERFVGKCLNSIKSARVDASDSVEVIVVLNRCTDKTEKISKELGAVLVREDARNLSKIRNAGVAAATGEIIVTIDADSTMSPNMFLEIKKKLLTGKFIGGGVRIKPERISLGIILSLLLIMPFALFRGVSSAGLFWCFKKDFDAVGGFNEELISIEDVDFALRLKALGKRSGKRFGAIYKGYIVTSCRKFDRFGDWYLVRNPGLVRAIFTGKDVKAADKFYYDYKN